MDLWLDDYGEYEIPPGLAALLQPNLRKDGWFDGRRKQTKALKAYFAANLRERGAIFMAGGDLAGWKPPPLSEFI